MKSIVLTGGGTIGHTAPHFAILPYLNFDEVYYIGSNGIEKEYVLNKGLPYYEINPVKLHRRLTIQNLEIPFKFINSINESVKILNELKPSVVFSKGGFVGLPVTIAANKLNIPVIIHESDLTLGLANKIASKFAKHTLTTFEKTSLTVKNGVYVGAIIRNELFSKSREEALNEFKIKTNKPILLVTGGSSGAKIINQTVINCLDELTKHFFVIHLVGKGNLTNTKNTNYLELEFSDMALLYQLCDIALSRAGSNTAFELTALKKVALYIPLSKKNSRGDQIDNANYFKNLKLCKVLYEEDLSPTTLIYNLLILYENKDYYLNNLNNYNFSLANEKIANILNKYWQV